MTSRRLRSLIGQLSFDLVRNMVLAKIKIHEHRTKQTYHNYTFQPLMSFWGDMTDRFDHDVSSLLADGRFVVLF